MRSAPRTARRRARNGVARHAPVACAGPLLVAELEALAAALESPKRPVFAIIGGSKVSTKIEVLQTLSSSKVDELILGGGIANTVLAAAGFPVGKSLHEADMVAVREAAARRQVRQSRDSAADGRRRRERASSRRAQAASSA